MNYNHLTINERACIYQYKQLGMSLRDIAKALKRNVSTISRELKRNNCGPRYKYLAHIAQDKYEIRRINSHRKTNTSIEAIEYIEEKIKINWSPEQIVNYEKNRPDKIPSVSTIYRWINLGYIISGDKTKLRRKGKFRRPAETRGRFNIGKTIKKRPRHIYKRQELGHWEADTVVSGRVGGKALSSWCFVTLA